jgi:hypothetical protein
MKKLRLGLESLSVESFATEQSGSESRGTVEGLPEGTGTFCSDISACGSDTDQWTCGNTCYNAGTCYASCFPCGGGGTGFGATCELRCYNTEPPAEQ